MAAAKAELRAVNSAPPLADWAALSCAWPARRKELL